MNFRPRTGASVVWVSAGVALAACAALLLRNADGGGARVAVAHGRIDQRIADMESESLGNGDSERVAETDRPGRGAPDDTPLPLDVPKAPDEMDVDLDHDLSEHDDDDDDDDAGDGLNGDLSEENGDPPEARGHGEDFVGDSPDLHTGGLEPDQDGPEIPEDR